MYNLHVCKFDHEHAQTIKFSFLLLFFLSFFFYHIYLPTLFCFSFRSIIPILCLYQSLLFSCLSLCTISSSHCVSFSSVFPFSYEEDISQSVCASASFTFRYFLFLFFYFFCFNASGQKQQASVESAIS